MTELENARLVRLLCKFGFINERPEYGVHVVFFSVPDVYFTVGSLASPAGRRRAIGTSSSCSGTMSSIRLMNKAIRLLTYPTS